MASGMPIAYRETAVRGPDGASIRVAGGYSTVALTSSEVERPAGARPRDGHPARHQRGPSPRGAARGVRGHGQPRAADAALADPRLHRDAPPPRTRTRGAAGLPRADRRGHRAPLGPRRPDPRRHPPPGGPAHPRTGAGPVRLARQPAAWRPRDLRAGRSPGRGPAGRPAAARGRRTAGRPDPGEPRRERVQVRTARRARDRQRGGRRRVARGRRRRRGRRDPRHGTAARHGTVPSRLERARNRASREPVSGCSSAGGSSRRTAVASASRIGRTDVAGTRVAFTLPLLRGPATSPGRRATTRAAASARGALVAETILIVEDEPEFAALVELWMARAGYRDRRGRDRDRRVAPLLRRAPGPRHPRCLAAGARWLADHRAHPRVQPDPHPDGHGAEL